MAFYKIKLFSRLSKLEIEELKKSLPSEYLLLQRMSLDPSLKSISKKIKYINKEFEFPWFEMIPLEENKREDYQKGWRLPIFYIDTLDGAVYYNFRDGVWETFQGTEIRDIKAYLLSVYNDSYTDWENGDYVEFMTEKDDVDFREYMKILIRSIKRYL